MCYDDATDIVCLLEKTDSWCLAEWQIPDVWLSDRKHPDINTSVSLDRVPRKRRSRCHSRNDVIYDCFCSMRVICVQAACLCQEHQSTTEHALPLRCIQAYFCFSLVGEKKWAETTSVEVETHIWIFSIDACRISRKQYLLVFLSPIFSLCN